jgi:hypothetical protein
MDKEVEHTVHTMALVAAAVAAIKAVLAGSIGSLVGAVLVTLIVRTHPSLHRQRQDLEVLAEHHMVLKVARVQRDKLSLLSEVS